MAGRKDGDPKVHQSKPPAPHYSRGGKKDFHILCSACREAEARAWQVGVPETVSMPGRGTARAALVGPVPTQPHLPPEPTQGPPGLAGAPT